ncbi:MAG: hypothetical protein R2879_18735 [Saprospiraceae bacterium]
MNFGHGRHHWVAKQKKSAIVFIESKESKNLSIKTISQIPIEIPILTLETDNEDECGILQLIIKSFFLVDKLGEIAGIDPGKPGVPEFGRKLYNLSFEKTLTQMMRINN